MPPITKMDRDVLVDKFTGCLVGLAIGEAMGVPAENLSTYQVLCKFHFIDGFFPGPSREIGHYSYETRAAVLIARAILENGGKIEQPAILAAVQDFEQKDISGSNYGSIQRLFSKVVPIGMVAGATGMDDQTLIGACKSTWNETLPSKSDMLAQFVFARTIRECIRNSDSLTSPFDLFESDRSLLHKTIHICAKAEAKMEFGANNRLCDRLAFVQKRLMSKRWSHEQIYGVMGPHWGAHEAIAMILYCFLRATDEYASVCDTVSLGGPAPIFGAMMGALIGSYIGASAKTFPADMKDSVQNGAKLEALAAALADCYFKKVEEESGMIEDNPQEDSKE